MFRQLCGDETLRNVILVTNMWGEVTLEDGEDRETELATNYFKSALDKGAQFTRHYNTVQSAHNIIRSIMKNIPIPLRIQRELVDENKDFIDTAASEAINKVLNEKIRQHEANLKAMQEEMKALKEKDEAARQELEEETQELREKMNQMMVDSESRASKYEEEKGRLEDMIKEMQEQTRKEREEAEAKYRQEMDDLTRQLRENAAEREELQQKINHLQHQWDTRDRGGCFIM